MHGASQSFLGLTHRMAEIRQNGRLQVLPSAIRIALLSLISRALSFSLRMFSHAIIAPLFPSVFSFFSFLAHKVSLTLSCSH